MCIAIQYFSKFYELLQQCSYRKISQRSCQYNFNLKFTERLFEEIAERKKASDYMKLSKEFPKKFRKKIPKGSWDNSTATKPTINEIFLGVSKKPFQKYDRLLNQINKKINSYRSWRFFSWENWRKMPKYNFVEIRKRASWMNFQRNCWKNCDTNSQNTQEFQITIFFFKEAVERIV